MWYVIQTITGKERELTEIIEKMLNGKSYDKCFVIQQECIWRLEGEYRIHIEPLFPSYVFVETETPEAFFFDLKKVPKLTKLLGNDGSFWTVRTEEEMLLCELIGIDQEYVVRCSFAELDESGNIVSAEGPLKNHVKSIVKKRLRKRYVVIKVPFLGETKRVRLGIWVKNDIKKTVNREGVLSE